MAKSYTVLATSHAQKFVKEIASNIEASKSSIEFDVVHTLKMYPFFVVADIIFGDLSSSQRQELRDLAPWREDLFREGIKGGTNRTGLAKWLRTDAYRMLVTYKMKWRQFIEDAYKQSVAHGKHGAIEQLWREAQKGVYLNFEECMQTLDEALYANLDVTTSAVSWCHILLAQHREFQAELREEILRHRLLPVEEWAEYINRSDTLLAFSVLESSRLRPILTFSNPESALEDKLVGKIIIPRNVDVIIDTFAINVDNPFWVNGTKFDPHRFEDLQPRQYRYHFWRFGFGPRQCLGKHVADRMIRALVAELLSTFDISLVPVSPENDFALQHESWVGLPEVAIKCVPIAPQF
ncbi:hypothetical protein BP6252_07504 [Coleophoma cylindrospora]|uniref:Uncharacterized protein n=1 Tax=Coleophoma cylindrospora TaxID=1849047 RepID=A0A3D8RAN3_9HELO|nr:hypothetical protein BP6252_07504 [Coleophoma cylindrospora]